MKYIFELLKLFEGFRKLLNEHFESERKELQERADKYFQTCTKLDKAYDDVLSRALEAEGEVFDLKSQVNDLSTKLVLRNLEIQELKNATTAKLKAVDTMPADDVFNAPVFQPRSTPRS